MAQVDGVGKGLGAFEEAALRRRALGRPNRRAVSRGNAA